MSLLAPSAPAFAVDRVPGEVLVQFERGTGEADRAAALSDAGAADPEALGAARFQLVRIADGDSLAQTIRELEADPAVRHAEPNSIEWPAAIPDDPLFGQLWGLRNTGQGVAGSAGSAGADIGAPAAWDIGVGDSSTVVAVMDSGIALDHPDLAPQLWRNPGEVASNGVDDDGNGYVDDVNGYDFIDGDPNPSDVDGHGTHVAGTAVARGNDGFGVTGVAQRAALMPLRVCAPAPTGCTVAAQIAAINYAAREGAVVLNGSLGGLGSENSVRREAIFSHPKTLFVFAAGNGDFPAPGDGEGDNNDEHPYFPCSHAPMGSERDNTLCVAATSPNDRRMAFSNFGPTSVDLGAPGSFVLSSGIRSDLFYDRFEAGAGDFAFNWPGSPDWERTNESPLTSFGITDSPGADYANDDLAMITSRPVTVRPGHSSCRLEHFRNRNLGVGDTPTVRVIRDGTAAFEEVFDIGHNTFAPGYGRIDLTDSLVGGGQVRIEFELATDAVGAGGGVHIDDVQLQCDGNGHEYLSGTSMAAPQVAGTVALLASRNPGTDGPELRQKILETTDRLGSLSGITTSGGRLDAGAAMGAMGADTAIGGGPAEGAELDSPSATFAYSSNDQSAGFECAVDAAPFAPCPTGSHVVGSLGPGQHVFAVRSRDARGNVDSTPATRRFSVESVAPETRIGRDPRKRTAARGASFRFSSSEAGSSFECRLDGKPFAPCTSPRRFRRVKPGRHRFQVRAVDAVGNVDPTPAAVRWRRVARKR